MKARLFQLSLVVAALGTFVETLGAGRKWG